MVQRGDKQASLTDFAAATQLDPTFVARGRNTNDYPQVDGKRVPPQHARSAVDSLRENVSRRFGSRAPEAAGQLVRALDEARAASPGAAAKLKEIEVGLPRQSSSAGPAPGMLPGIPGNDRLPSAYTFGSGLFSLAPRESLGSIGVATPDRGQFLHEFGHATDHNLDPKIFDELGHSVRDRWPYEVSATNRAFSAMGGARDPKLLGANGSYFEVGSGATLSPRALRGDVRLALTDAGARTAGQLTALQRLKLRKDDLPAPQRELYDRLMASAGERGMRRTLDAQMLMNPVLAPGLQQKSQPTKPHPSAVAAIDQHYGAGAADLAYGAEEALRQRHLAQEHPAVAGARMRLGIEATPQPLRPGLARVAKSTGGALTQTGKLLLSKLLPSRRK